MHARVVALLAAGSVALSGCASSGDQATRHVDPPASEGSPVTVPTLDTPPSVPPDPSPADRGESAKSALPDLAVDDVSAGTKVNLSSLAPAPEPILLWFWAPH